MEYADVDIVNMYVSGKSLNCIEREIGLNRYQINKVLKRNGITKRVFRKDFIGQRFGKLVVLSKGTKPTETGGRFWLCECDCGNIVEVPTNNLKTKNTKSCGCNRIKHPKEFGRATYIYSMYSSIKSRAKRAGIPFDLVLEDLVVPEYCPVFPNIKLEKGVSRKPSNSSPSFDRIDPLGGYTKDNVQILSNYANTVKNNATKNELKLLISWLDSVLDGTFTVGECIIQPRSKIKKWYYQIHARARQRNLHFTLDFDDLYTPKYCPVLGIKMCFWGGRAYDSTYSVDRIVPDAGYTKDNIHIISYKANRFKGSASLDDLKTLYAYRIRTENI